MRIINNVDKRVEFVSIEVGECFTHDNCLFIKASPTKSSGSANAFCFVDNAMACIPQTCLVTPVEAEVVIRSKGVQG